MNTIMKTSYGPAETLRLLKYQAQDFAWIDVRSESEAQEGSLPHFINLPILQNEERHQVGITYKNEGREAALKLGYSLTAEVKEYRTKLWIEKLHNVKNQAAILSCWRGGLRSKIATSWINEKDYTAFQIEGGYKALRRELLKSFQGQHKLIVLTGLTGSGKTQLLREVSCHKLDLEDLAQHRGSCFGQYLHIPQPSQASFENALALELYENQNTNLIEDESYKIGRLILPSHLKESMKRSPLILVHESIEKRIENIFKEYIISPLSLGQSMEKIESNFISNLKWIEKPLGGLRYQDIRQQMYSAFRKGNFFDDHQTWIKSLLKEHYDPQYYHAFKRLNRPILFQGTPKEVIEFISQYKALNDTKL